MRIPGSIEARSDERGMGLLFGLFAAALVAAVAWTMITNGLVDMTISDNYRNHSSAFYAADAGLEQTLIDFKVDTDWILELIDLESLSFNPPSSATITVNGIDIEVELDQAGLIVPRYYPMGPPTTIGEGTYQREVYLPPLVAVGDCAAVQVPGSGDDSPGATDESNESGKAKSGKNKSGKSEKSGATGSGKAAASGASGDSASGKSDKDESGKAKSGKNKSGKKKSGEAGDDGSGAVSGDDPCDLLQQVIDSSEPGDDGSGKSKSGKDKSGKKKSGKSGSGASGSGASGGFASLWSRVPASLGTPLPAGLGLVPAALAPLTGTKTTICHLPPGNPDNAQTLSVGTSAVAAHVAHGDYVGACADGGDEDGDGIGDEVGDLVNEATPVIVILRVRSTGTADGGASSRILADLAFTVSTSNELLDIAVQNWREDR